MLKTKSLVILELACCSNRCYKWLCSVKKTEQLGSGMKVIELTPTISIPNTLPSKPTLPDD